MFISGGVLPQPDPYNKKPRHTFRRGLRLWGSWALWCLGASVPTRAVLPAGHDGRGDSGRARGWEPVPL